MLALAVALVLAQENLNPADPRPRWCADLFIMKSAPPHPDYKHAVNLWTEGEREFTWDLKRKAYIITRTDKEGEKPIVAPYKGVQQVGGVKALVLDINGETITIEQDWKQYMKPLMMYKPAPEIGPGRQRLIWSWVHKMKRDYAIGERVTLPKLTLADGRTIDHTAIAGKPTVIVYFGTWQSETFWTHSALGMEKIHKKWSPKGVKVIGIFADGKMDAANKYVPMERKEQSDKFADAIAWRAKQVKMPARLTAPVAMVWVYREMAELMVFEQPAVWVLDSKGKVVHYLRGWNHGDEPNTVDFYPKMVDPILTKMKPK